MDILSWLASPSLQKADSSAWPSALRQRSEDGSSAFPLRSTHLHALLKILEAGQKPELRPDEYQRRGLPNYDDPLWQSFVNVYFMPWFSRLWTFEEAMLAKDCAVRCGAKVVAWKYFYEYGMALSHTELLFRPGLDVPTQRQSDGETHFTRLRSHMYAPEDGHYFWLYVSGGRTKEVSKRVDRIYALRALANGQVRNEIPVHYELEDEYWKVYITASKVMMKHHNLQSVLHGVPSPERRPELPSWCPDYNSLLESWAVSSFGQAGFGGRPKPFRTDPNLPNTIFVGGAEVDHIARVVSGFDWQWSKQDPRLNEGPDGCASKNAEWMDRCWAMTRRLHPDESAAVDAYWQAMLGHVPGNDAHNFPQHPARGLQALRTRLGEIARRVDRQHSALEVDDWAKVGQVLGYMGIFWRKRVFFSPARGRLGHASRFVQDVDRICVFFGEPYPHVLRPKAHDQHAYVAYAYVRGMMLGECMKGLVDDDGTVFSMS